MVKTDTGKTLKNEMNFVSEMRDNSTVQEYSETADDSQVRALDCRNSYTEKPRHHVLTHHGDIVNDHGYHTSRTYKKMTEKEQNRPKVDVYMIDFTHVYHADDIDTGYLEGLENFVSYLGKLLK